MTLLDKIGWSVVALLCLTLGMAPFLPAPHIWDKLMMLAEGDLRRPIDIFDLVFHALPWLLALAKVVRAWRRA